MENAVVKGLGLFSGGLDSILAVKVLQDQGIEVIGITFQTPFFGPQQASKAAEEIGIPLIVKDFTQRHLEMLKDPPSGYGSNMNPCIDCHALMLSEAGKIMEREGYHFLFTGEVLNERPMSQNRNSLARVAKRSGYKPYVLRPLSAKLLPETRPEQEGFVDRKRLLNISGRGRKPQMALAKHYAVKNYPAPAGGCLLTDPNFSFRLKELFHHNWNCSIQELELLKIGRHFRIDGTKIVVGRDERENDRLRELVEKDDVLLSGEHIPGPLVLISGGGSSGVVKRAAGLCVRYSDAKHEDTMPLVNKVHPGTGRIRPQALSEEEIEVVIIKRPVGRKK